MNVTSGPATTRTDTRVSRSATRFASARTEQLCKAGGGICASWRYPCKKRLREAARPSIMLSPRSKSCCSVSLIPLPTSRECKLPAMDLIGASELFSSCPNTRINRCHARRSSSRNARLTSDRTTRVCGIPCWRNELLRTNHRASVPKCSSTRDSFSHERQGASPKSELVLPTSCAELRSRSLSPAEFTSRSLFV